MSDDDEEIVRLFSTQPPPADGVHEALTVIGKAPDTVLAMVRTGADETERVSGAPTVRPAAPDAAASDEAISAPLPPALAIGLLLSLSIVALALLAR